MSVQLHEIKRHAGIAGQFSVTAETQYPDEDARSVEFIGSVYGGPVVMRTGSTMSGAGIETFVTAPDRFGEFGVEWVRRFFDHDDEL